VPIALSTAASPPRATVRAVFNTVWVSCVVNWKAQMIDS